MRRLYATALELGPLVLFFIANGRWGIFVGTAVFIVATAIALPCYRWLERRWPVMPLVGGFFVLAAVNEVMWRFFSTDTWIASKMLLSFPLTLVFAFLQVPLLKRYWDGDDNPFASGG